MPELQTAHSRQRKAQPQPFLQAVFGWRNRLMLVPCLFALGAPVLLGQAGASTASRRADLQVGLGFVYDRSNDTSNYITNSLKGLAFYTTLDLTRHLGGEFVIHQANTSASDSVYERTYELGPRYSIHYGKLAPYAKAMYGRGVFNFPNGEANLAYNLLAFGAGADLRVLSYLNLRLDYEYQRWSSFPPNGLNPQLFTIGVAYHFPGDLRRGQHY